MQSKKLFLVFLGLYALLRVFSYFFSPETPLYSANPVNTLAAALVLFTAIYFLLKKDQRGWLIVAGELILGGGGNYLAVGPLSLRTSLLFASLLIYFAQLKRGGAGHHTKDFGVVAGGGVWAIFLLIVVAIIAAGRGLYLGHATRQIFSDTLPYFFLLYYFPLRDLIKSDNFKSVCKQMLFAAIVGNALFMLLTYAGFSSGLFALQDEYYHWFRDVALGKITDIGFNSFRIILDEHLLLVPLLLAFLSSVIATPSSSVGLKAATLAMTFVLSINITRIYILAFVVGLLFLFSKTNWRRWLAISSASLVLFFIFFTSLHLISSRGQNLGWEYFGLRLQSVMAPQIEESSLSRVLLLPKIWEKIKAHPLLGNGLGDTVTVYSPALKQTITTPHFDWGYLEIWAEVGLLGLFIWILLLTKIIPSPIRGGTEGGVTVAPLASLLVINLTSPAIFHAFGVIFLTFYFTHYGSNQNSD
ncbi:O-antigen ligase domain-containing protein [Patescibacteria group bacterium]|nr:MAG: O-antigen ligase domain-containing protein [Patescibacteria group bacterium]